MRHRDRRRKRRRTRRRKKKTHISKYNIKRSTCEQPGIKHTRAADHHHDATPVLETGHTHTHSHTHTHTLSQINL